MDTNPMMHTLNQLKVQINEMAQTALSRDEAKKILKSLKPIAKLEKNFTPKKKDK